MDIENMHINLDLEIDKTDSLDSVGFETEEKDSWLNSAIRQLTKTKYSGSGSRGAFEQNQKRIDDLRTLVYEDDITVTRATSSDDKPNSYKASLSSTTESYWFTVSEEVDIVYQSSTTAVSSGSLTVDSYYLVTGTGTVTHNDGSEDQDYTDGDYFKAANTAYSVVGTASVYPCTTVRQGVTETTSNNYRQDIDNPYSEHVFENNKAKPLRLYRNTDVELITDGQYGITTYYIRYIKQPIEVNYSTGTDCDLPEHVHDEVVKLAANMILENIESPRYQTHTIEVNRTE